MTENITDFLRLERYPKREGAMYLHQKSNKASCWVATENSLHRNSFSQSKFCCWQKKMVSIILGIFTRHIFAIFSTNRKRFVSKIAKICLAKIPKCSWPVSLSDNKISCRKSDCAGRESKVGNKIPLLKWKNICQIPNFHYTNQ